MKKYLYASTAIIGVTALATGAQAQGVEADIGGFVNGYYGIADVDNGNLAGGDDFQEFNYQEAQMAISGSVTLDNGIEAGIFVENELEGGVAEADEQYLYLSGSFGTLQLGQNNGGAYQTHAFGSQAYAAGIPVNSGWTAFNPTGGYDGNFYAPGYSTFPVMTNDHNGVVYISPRFGGFQLSGSWHPTAGDPAEGANQGTGGSVNLVNDNAVNNNAFSAGLNFSRDFQGVGLDASAGIATEDRPASPNGDPVYYSGSAAISVAGFSFGGDVLVQDDGSRAGGTSNEGTSYALGTAYSTGPWTVGVNGSYASIEGSLANSDEDGRLAITSGIDYALGPGVTLSSSVFYEQFTTEENGDGQGEILAGALGASVSF